MKLAAPPLPPDIWAATPSAAQALILLYVTSRGPNSLAVFTLDGSGNVTGQQPGSPFPTGGNSPIGVAAR